MFKAAKPNVKTQSLVITQKFDLKGAFNATKNRLINDKTSFNGKLNKKHNSSVADSEDNG
jgi:hypothetical protein